MKSLTYRFFALSVLVCSAFAAEPVTQERPQVVSVAELIGRPTAFEGKRIEVEGYWVSGFEWSYLSATRNNVQALPIWLERWMMAGDADATDRRAIKAAIEAADQKAGFVAKGHSRQYRIRCVGIFSHVTVRRATPDQPGIGFGHLGVYPSEFRLEKIVEIHAVPLPEDFFPRLPE